MDQLLRQGDHDGDRPLQLAMRMPDELAGLQVGDILDDLFGQHIRSRQDGQDEAHIDEKRTPRNVAPIRHFDLS